MITKSELLKRISRRLNLNISWYKLEELLEEEKIEPEVTTKTPITSVNGNSWQQPTFLYDEEVVEILLGKHIKNLEKEGKAISIPNLVKKYNVTRNTSIWKIMESRGIKHTTLKTGAKTTYIVGKYKTQIERYLEKEYKPRKTYEETTANIEQTSVFDQQNENEVLKEIQNIIEKLDRCEKQIEIYKKNEKTFREIIDKLKYDNAELQNRLLNQKKSNFMEKVIQMVRR